MRLLPLSSRDNRSVADSDTDTDDSDDDLDNRSSPTFRSRGAASNEGNEGNEGNETGTTSVSDDDFVSYEGSELEELEEADPTTPTAARTLNPSMHMPSSGKGKAPLRGTNDDEPGPADKEKWHDNLGAKLVSVMLGMLWFHILSQSNLPSMTTTIWGVCPHLSKAFSGSLPRVTAVAAPRRLRVHQKILDSELRHADRTTSLGVSRTSPSIPRAPTTRGTRSYTQVSISIAICNSRAEISWSERIDG